ncbi:unnamed protein product [Pseudo-nitzschia multistriata]|uniref:Uncharacterized protein n=1 Tax=Pseudo-nitzschia multistriata TaxID=183589 RepID=A0A448ZPY5_9STRA|nr:unnamed protein product [Pseudo-nitzschia multistriata]
MFGNKKKTKDTRVRDLFEYLCTCTPCWECLLDDYDCNYNFTLRDRVEIWKDTRRYKRLRRIESKERERSERNQRSTWRSMGSVI